MSCSQILHTNTSSLSPHPKHMHKNNLPYLKYQPVPTKKYRVPSHLQMWQIQHWSATQFVHDWSHQRTTEQQQFVCKKTHYNVSRGNYQPKHWCQNNRTRKQSCQLADYSRHSAFKSASPNLIPVKNASNSETFYFELLYHLYSLVIVHVIVYFQNLFPWRM